MTGIALTSSVASNATTQAAYPFGVHSYRTFENKTAEKTLN